MARLVLTIGSEYVVRDSEGDSAYCTLSSMGLDFVGGERIVVFTFVDNSGTLAIEDDGLFEFTSLDFADGCTIEPSPRIVVPA